MLNWTELVGLLGGQVILLAAVGWLCKALLSHRLTRDADAFRARLKADTDIEIERLRTSLQIAATEHQVRFSKLHQKRGFIIAKLHRLLLEAADAAMLVAANPRDIDYLKQAHEKHLELYRFFHFNTIYLPTAVCGLLGQYENKVRHSVVFIRIYMREEHPTPQMIEEQNKVLLEAWRALETELPSMRKELEKEFRVLLGVTD